MTAVLALLVLSPAHAEEEEREPPIEEVSPENLGGGAEPTAASLEVDALEFDADGDGVVDAEEQALQADEAKAFDGISDEIEPADPEAFAKEAENPSTTDEEFLQMIAVAKAKVLDRLQSKMAGKQDERMSKISALIGYFSLAGLLLLLMPLVLRKKYPGQTGVLFKYSALAAVTFVVTVNLFGGVVLGMRGAQAALGELANPQLRVAEGFFDSLAADPGKFKAMVPQLFGPTLKSLEVDEAQPVVTLLENGQKLIGDAKVFTSIADMFKKIDFVFALLPIVLLALTLVLFILALRPTLVAIIKMPGQVAAGDQAAARGAVRIALRRVVGEIKAAACTIGVLLVLSLLSAFVLGHIVVPTLDLLIQYFAAAVLYLQLEPAASGGFVFVALFGVILTLVLSLAAIILSTAFVLGKTQKIFQQRFSEGVPLASHARFWRWGTLSLLVAQLVPMLFAIGASRVVIKVTEQFIGGDGVSWKPLFLVGPLMLVSAFLLVFWAARGIQAIKFLATYKVKPPVPPSDADSARDAA